ncbi:putative WRKY transcription factor 70 [Panicum miliaceum]|uniref:WRKY transcription factor 70 n=1 Tax=Panicum miliaceum TaxID=4540 RepID=A0A3L6T2T5_PANMI|nr:putative WRKY transcription factor 70 [Panicum miliaceum]
MAAPATAASELVAKGRRSAASLRAMLGQQPAVGGAGATPHGLQVQDLVDKILRCCDRALAALRATEDAASSARKRRKPEQGAAPTPATSSNSKRMSETSDLCHSPEEKAELRAGMGNVPESSSEQSTPPPVPELTSMSSPEWDPLDGCLIWDDMGFGESLFDDIGQFSSLDYVGLFQ